MTRKAVVLFNLGGPDGPDAVEPFLFNLFNDAAIIRLPAPLRFLIAKLISKRRAPVAKEIYAEIGGASPLLAETKAQAAALEGLLNENASEEDIYGVFIAMRYWHPFAYETVTEVKSFGADEIYMLPLYPQFSSTTTASSFDDWEKAAKKAGLTAPVARLCCYPAEAGLVSAYADLIKARIVEMGEAPFRLLFSAHGLPQKIVDAGDPYQWQVEQTAKAVAGKIAMDGLDWRVCYQSRVGPMKWLQPSTDAEIEAAGSENLSLIVVPIAFVSEHSETLVELDIEYGKLAVKAGVPRYLRVPTVSAGKDFIAGLARMVANMKTGDITGGTGQRLCPAGFADCRTAATK
ncbi:MAG: ferrochelatase [Alphaproteobacteria bacterium]|nr:MAG: ferrochelatase [Alphaproteobacteria bacterium]